MNNWTLSHGKDGWAVELTRVPWWLPVTEWAGESILAGTGHIICCKMPEWTWNVPLGLPKRDPKDGMLNNSLGGAAYSLFQRLSSPFWRHAERLERIAITRTTAYKLNPEWVVEVEELFADDEVQDAK